jgi:crotonobetainyl-CoA:carnitine CoA-transferase CaiB-like acyl-CoA transferase
VTETVRQWRANELEAAIVAKNGCAAEMRTTDQWSDHPQGRALAAEPLIVQTGVAGEKSEKWRPSASRPLSGIRVLDLTRVLAGPVATRFLAGYGADVLRVDPLDWDEPGLIPEVTLGKRCVRFNLHDRTDRETFERLLGRADVLVHGYRKGALDGLGYGETERQSIRPGLIDVSLNAYGHSGPWEMRRGFDSLVQMSAGIADAGMAWKQSGKPYPLPVQALDQATGYLMAAAVVRGLVARIADGSATTAHLSLARTAKLLSDHKGAASELAMPPLSPADLASDIEQTSWGPARRLKPPAALDCASVKWDLPATALGSGTPSWLSR